MREFNLLAAVQPSRGWYCAIGIPPHKGGVVRQKLVETIEELNSLTDTYVQEGYNAFFAVAKFDTNQNRTKENVRSLKAFWLDIDCGPSKAKVNPDTGYPEGYIDQKKGLSELRRFCKVTGMPKPIIVNSGRGLHVYWALEEEVTREQWEPVATRLRQVCLTQQLFVDGSVFEVSRILRIPGTLNFKDDPPTPVSVLGEAPPVSFDTLKGILGVTEEAFVAPRPVRKLTALGKSIMDNMESSFTKIMLRSGKKDNGCQQLLSCYTGRGQLSEPRWWDALSIATFCADRDKAIHMLSDGHPDYTRAAVEKKIQGVKGPHSCLEFEKNNPGGCEGCSFRGKIKSPISLGKEVTRASEEDNIIDVAPEGEDPSLVTIPDFPSPFFRGKNGGIWITDGDEDPKLVYENDLYVVSRMNDPHVGDVVVLKAHMPRDGIKEFVIPNSKITERAELRRELAKQGVVTTENQFKLLSMFIVASIRYLQHKKKADIMRVQFGWADNDTKFIVGNREITKDNVYTSPPSSITEELVPYMEPCGTIEKWAEVFNLYNRPGLEVQAFAALSGFGSTLLKFTGQKGAVINLIHSLSGAGKTTVLRVANSICGDPDLLLGKPEDTAASRPIKLGILNNIVNTVDEMTNISGEVVSDFLYGASHGRGKDKAEASANKLRKNYVTWRSISLGSSNASFVQKLYSVKKVPDGELMRLLEFHVAHTAQDIISTQEGLDVFDKQLSQNYGLAIVPFMQYVIGNLEEVKRTIDRVQNKIIKDLKLTQRERNWSATMAATFTAGLIVTKYLNLVELDMTRIYAKVVPLIRTMRKELTPPVSDGVAIISDYVYRNMDCILAIDSVGDIRSSAKPLPRMVPRRELKIRIEPDTKTMYLIVDFFKSDCVDLQTDYKELLKGLKSNGVLKGTENKRVSKGMKLDIKLNARCLVIDCDNSNFFDVEKLLPEEGEKTDDEQVADEET